MKRLVGCDLFQRTEGAPDLGGALQCARVPGPGRFGPASGYYLSDPLAQRPFPARTDSHNKLHPEPGGVRNA